MRKLADNQNYTAITAAKKIYHQYREWDWKFVNGREDDLLSDDDLEKIYHNKCNIYRRMVENFFYEPTKIESSDKRTLRMLKIAEVVAKLENMLEERAIEICEPFHLSAEEEAERLADFSDFDKECSNGKTYYAIIKDLHGNFTGEFLNDPDEIENEDYEVVKLLEVK